MGMTINDHIEVLKSYNHGFTAQAGNLQDSIDVAVDIMRKYKKIEQIIKCPLDIQEDVFRYKAICEVVEDGNDD